MVGVPNCPLCEVVHYCADLPERDQSKRLLIIRKAGCPLLRGFEYIEVYGNIIRAFRIVRYIAGVAVEGCPLSGVPL